MKTVDEKMPTYNDEADPDDDLDSRDDPDESDMDREDDPAMVPCPYCRRKISEDAEICSHCGNFISAEEGHAVKPWWIVVTVAVLVAVIVLGWVMIR